MNNQEKLDILNSMEHVDSDIRSDEIVYVFVEYNQENLDKLAKVVPDLNEYMKNCGDPDGEKEFIDISVAALQYVDADYYDGHFKILDVSTLTAMLEEERMKRISAESELVRIKTGVKMMMSTVFGFKMK